MVDPLVNTRRRWGSGPAYSLAAYLRGRNRHAEWLSIRTFSFNAMYRGAVNLAAAAVAEDRPDVVGFSVYCWNLQFVSDCIRALRVLVPKCTIVLGGPEVSYDAESKLRALPEGDIVVRGEGEITFNELIETLAVGGSPDGVLGLTFRDEGDRIMATADRPLHPCLDDYPSPFLTGVIDLASCNGEVAYESVRGCKYRCSFCLHTKGASFVRAFSLSRVADELRLILSCPTVQMVWFVDPTFNADEERALAILKIVESVNPRVQLAFELRADLLTEPLMAQMARLNVAEVGIGLQTVSTEGNRNIARKQRLDVTKRGLERLRQAIGQTCSKFDIDIIYGLPGDCYETYRQTVEFIMGCGCRVYYQPLRVFSGTKLHRDAADFGLCFGAAPYNVVRSTSYPPGDMVSSYCLNAGLDFYNRHGVYAEILDFLAESAGRPITEILERAGRFFWMRERFEMFRPSNWTPDDRPDATVRRAFCEYITQAPECTAVPAALRARIDEGSQPSGEGSGNAMAGGDSTSSYDWPPNYFNFAI